MIDEYVTGLRRELRGPYLHRVSMIREVRDGLCDAAAAHRDAGATPAQAERRAVEEFGPAELVGAELREELAAATGRYLAAVVIVLGAAQMALAHYTWTTAAAAQGWPTPTPAYAALARAVDLSNVVVLVGAALAVLALGAGARVLRTRSVVRVTAIVTLVGLGLKVVGGAVLAAFAPASPSHWDGFELVLMTALTVGSTVWIGWLAWRCLWLTSTRRVGPEDRADDGVHLVPGFLLRD